MYSNTDSSLEPASLSIAGATATEAASEDPASATSLTDEAREPVQVMLVGSQPGVSSIIKSLHALGFAEAGDWSKPQRYPNSDRSMSIMTKWRQP